jgi:hypothetical protein
VGVSEPASVVATRRRDRRIDLGLALLVLLVSVPVVQELRAQQASRLALTAAIWDDHSLRIDGYPIGVDRAEVDGHIYSDKAPGQPVLAIPAYAVYRTLGGEPARVFREQGNLGLWAVSAWSSALPAAGLVVLLRRAAARDNPAVAPQVALALAFGTLLLPFSTLLFGHVLATAAAFAGWYVATRHEPSSRALVGSGLLLGLSVLVEYTMVPVAAAVAAHALWVHRRRGLLVVAAGIPAAIGLLAYQWAAFGSPFTFSYSQSAFRAAADDKGLRDLHLPLAERAFKAIAGERGLLVVSPVLLLAIVGMVIAIRAARGPRRSGLIAAAVAAGSVIAVQMAWSNPTGGDSPGPRYATAAAAFLLPGLVVAWQRWRLASLALATIGTLIMFAATFTDPIEARDSSNAIGIWLGKLFRGEWTDTLFSQALGRNSASVLVIPLALGGAALVASLLRGSSTAAPPTS